MPHIFTPTRLAALFACAAALLAAPSAASAQCMTAPGQNTTEPCLDQQPPAVTVSPPTSQLSQPAVPVLVTWWDESGNTIVDRITVNGVDVRGAFEVTRDTASTIMPDRVGQVLVEEGAARGTVQLVAGQVNVLEVRICDRLDHCSPLSIRHLTIGTPGVRVTQDGQVIAVLPAATRTTPFKVHNTGGQAATFTVSAECRNGAGQPVTPCSVSPAGPSIAVGDSALVTATYAATQAGGTMHVLVRARQVNAPGIEDAGWTDVIIRQAAGTATVAPQAVLVPLTAGPARERGQCVTVATALRGAYECGDLRIMHALPVHRTRGRTWSPTLLYNTDLAHPRPIVYADVTVPAGAATPSSVEMVVTMSNGVVHRAAFRGSDFTAGNTRRIGVQWDALNTGTGLYSYTAQVISHYASGPRPTDGMPGEIAIVNRADSYFGAGWWLAGLERISCVGCSPTATRLLWVGGDGSTRVYDPSGNGRWIAQNPDGPADTLVLGDSGYVRKLRGGGAVYYDAYGLHYKTVNRLGQATRFTYSGNGLAAIYAPGAGPGGPGTGDPAWTMSWDNAAQVVRGITATAAGAPARTTALTIDASKRVTAITDPDSLWVGFDYNAYYTRRVTRQRDRRGTYTWYSFTPAGKLRSAQTQMGATQNAAVDPTRWFVAAEGQGVAFDSSTAAVSIAAPLAYTRIDGPRTDVADHTHLWLTRSGAVRHVRDALGGATFVEHDPRFPALATRVTGPTGQVSRVHYDARGRVDTATVENPLGDGRSQATVYQYDDRWDAPTAVTDYVVSAGGSWAPLSGAARAAYDSLNGNVLWQQQGDDSARRTTFTYYTTGAAAGQLRTVSYPADAQGKTARDSLAYDANGNVSLSRGALGYFTLRFTDGLGRDTLVITPTRADSATSVTGVGNTGARQRITYDVMNQVRRTEAIGPAITHPLNPIDNWAPAASPQERLFTETTYENEGLPLRVTRWSDPDVGQVNELWTTFVYDAAGRMLTETESSAGAGKRFEYDQAGNVTGSAPLTGPMVHTEYDALGRVVKRTVPAVTYASGCAGGFFTACDWRFPLYPTGAAGTLLIPEQVTYLRYDSAGNMVYAENADAIVRRSYYANGALRGDTLQPRNYATADYDQGYGLEYTYDLAGRPVSLSHPQNLGGVENLDRFFYNLVTGAVDSIVDRRGFRFGFEHDLLGQLVGRTASGGVTETFRYDVDGRRTFRQLAVAGSIVMSDTLAYDGRGKILRADNMSSVHTQWYAGLGALVATDWANLGDLARNREEFTVDPLGHVARRRTSGDQQSVTDPNDWITRYAMGSSAIMRAASVWPVNYMGFKADSTEQERDARGNLWRDREWGWGTQWTGVTAVTRLAEARHYYDAEQRLRVVQRQDDTYDGGGTHRASGVWEEYRYDPLGRRVMVRTRRESELCNVSNAVCLSSITRFVWAGDQLLWELRAPGAEGNNLEATMGSGERFGRVSYTHGGGLDRPLALHKEGYASLVPHENWRGQFASGTCVGAGAGCGAVVWPGWQTNAYHAMTTVPQSENWRGGLVDGMRDATGQMYMRNRYYDPETGQFTQPDPIGIAGGLNVYGFAAGDPVTYSDPYGLSSQGPCDPPGSCEAMGVAAGAVVGGFVGAVVAGGCTIGSGGVCALGAPGVVSFFSAGGAAFGGLLGVVADAVAGGEEEDAASDAGPPREIPATGARVTPAQREAIQRMGEVHGCHECGATSPGRNPRWVGDHVPESALVPSGTPQVLRPHCWRCSDRQGGRTSAEVKRRRSRHNPLDGTGI